jgi:adenosylmethionine decarboxylase proenzyme (EC 4.1.1.50)
MGVGRYIQILKTLLKIIFWGITMINMTEGINALGKQLIIDAWGCKNLDNDDLVKKMLEESAKACHATLLSVHTHLFAPQGISGVAIIAESHISIHTWPEHSYAAIDIFTCGKEVEPYNAVGVDKKDLLSRENNTQRDKERSSRG